MKVIVNNEYTFEGINIINIKRDSANILALNMTVSSETVPYSYKEMEEIFSNITSLIVVRDPAEGEDISEDFSIYDTLYRLDQRITDSSSSFTIMLTEDTITVEESTTTTA